MKQTQTYLKISQTFNLKQDFSLFNCGFDLQNSCLLQGPKISIAKCCQLKIYLLKKKKKQNKTLHSIHFFPTYKKKIGIVNLLKISMQFVLF